MRSDTPTEQVERGTFQSRDIAQAVIITDRIAWQWYFVTAAVPLLGALVGFIAGIVFMARSKIGPALALWATAYLATAIWGVIGWAVLFSLAVDEVSDQVAAPAVTRSVAEEQSEATSSPQDEASAPGEDESTGGPPIDCEPVGVTQTRLSPPDVLTAANTTCATARQVSHECLVVCSRGTGDHGAIVVVGSVWRCITRHLSTAEVVGSRTTCRNDQSVVKFGYDSGH